MSARLLSFAIPFLVACAKPLFAAESKPSAASGIVTLDTPRSFPTINSTTEWQKRARQIQQQVLISAGLWPMPQKQPLEPHIYGRIERDGYSVEKVYFQTYPGFYLAGNLYRPIGSGKGPFPAILNPHGHWADGRLADNKDGSIAARCISFARQGWIAFSYDMVGFNDTYFPDQPVVGPDKFYIRHRDFATNDVNQLWNINLLGLQTWNSIRALDFIESLPEVDRHRLACTGESGGGTQTYLLGAIDDRLAAQVPVVMVSHTMQGGCGCENAPGLRVQYSNMEIAAAAVPWRLDPRHLDGRGTRHSTYLRIIRCCECLSLRPLRLQSQLQPNQPRNGLFMAWSSIPPQARRCRAQGATLSKRARC